MRMVPTSALSIFLLPIVTVLGSQFGGDIDTLHNELSSPNDLPTQASTNEAQQVESTHPGDPHISPSPDEMDEKRLENRRQYRGKYIQKNVTLSAAEVDAFTQNVIIDKSYPEITSLGIIENKLLALRSLEEWFDLDDYDIYKYSKYWAKVCVLFWGKPADRSYRYCCTVSANYGINKKKTLTIRRKKRRFDLLYCKCHNYENYYRIPHSEPEIFLIHKSDRNEFYIFEQNNDKLIIKGLKGGITLPHPLDEKQVNTRVLKFAEKYVTLGIEDIEFFNQSLTIEKSYPENISLAELEDKLMEFKEINEWPDLQNVDLYKYSMYWGNLCVSLWGKQLDRAQRQACTLSTSYGGKKIRKLFINGRILYFDLLFCKCNSYIRNCQTPVSSVDTFLIHQASENEFFVFDQRATTLSQFTLFIKYLRRLINLPDYEAFR